MLELIINHMTNFINKNLIRIKFALKIMYYVTISQEKCPFITVLPRDLASRIMDITCSTHESR